ncbi:hypothetical protein ACFX13_025279 [Malus domestica]
MIDVLTWPTKGKKEISKIDAFTTSCGFRYRLVWEFHPETGTPEELQQIEDARKAFWNHRFERRQSSDLLMRIQFAKENPCATNLPQLKVF